MSTNDSRYAFIHLCLANHYKCQTLKAIPRFFFIQITYVGNAAYAHIVAKNRLRENSDCAGEVYYITDDTPLDELYVAIKPFVEAQATRLSDWSMPYLVAILIMSLISIVLKIIRPIYQVS